MPRSDPAETMRAYRAAHPEFVEAERRREKARKRAVRALRSKYPEEYQEFYREILARIESQEILSRTITEEQGS